MSTITGYERPGDLDAAARLLERDGAALLGGGARIVPAPPAGTTTLIDLTDCGLRTADRTDASLRLGAGLRLEELVVRRDCDALLAKAAMMTAPSLNLRNQMTLGGETAWRAPGGDIQPLQAALLAADALVVRHGEAPLALEGYLKLDPRGGIITALEIPKVKDRRYRLASIEAARGGRPDLVLALCATPEKSRPADCRVAVGVPGRVAERLADVELALEGGQPGELEEAIPDFVNEVQRRWIGVLTRRLCAELTGEADHV